MQRRILIIFVWYSELPELEFCSAHGETVLIDFLENFLLSGQQGPSHTGWGAHCE